MTAPTRRKAAHATSTDSSRAVDEFMATLEHPFKEEVQLIRALVLAVDPSIAEGIKWNAPSFRTTEYFATTHLRARIGVGVILHLGAKSRALPADGLSVSDPENLLHWLAKDRAAVAFTSPGELREKAAAFQAILRQWIAFV